jgi:hypothetical protein
MTAVRFCRTIVVVPLDSRKVVDGLERFGAAHCTRESLGESTPVCALARSGTFRAFRLRALLKALFGRVPVIAAVH